MNTTTRNTLKTLVAAASLITAFATGAQAAEASQVHVSYADLNLHTAAGAAALNRRIKRAAEQVCGFSGDRDLARQAQFKACTARAIADAVASLKNANVQLASTK